MNDLLFLQRGYFSGFETQKGGAIAVSENNRLWLFDRGDRLVSEPLGDAFDFLLPGHLDVAREQKGILDAGLGILLWGVGRKPMVG